MKLLEKDTVLFIETILGIILNPISILVCFYFRLFVVSSGCFLGY